jgi:hypothetical protein
MRPKVNLHLLFCPEDQPTVRGDPLACGWWALGHPTSRVVDARSRAMPEGRYALSPPCPRRTPLTRRYGPRPLTFYHSSEAFTRHVADISQQPSTPPYDLLSYLGGESRDRVLCMRCQIDVDVRIIFLHLRLFVYLLPFVG